MRLTLRLLGLGLIDLIIDTDDQAIMQEDAATESNAGGQFELGFTPPDGEAKAR